MSEVETLNKARSARSLGVTSSSSGNNIMVNPHFESSSIVPESGNPVSKHAVHDNEAELDNSINAARDEEDQNLSDDDLLAAFESSLETDQDGERGEPELPRRRTYESAFSENVENGADDLVESSERSTQRSRTSTYNVVSESTTRSESPVNNYVHDDAATSTSTSTPKEEITIRSSTDRSTDRTTRSNSPIVPNPRHNYSMMNPIEMSDEEGEDVEKSGTEEVPFEIEDSELKEYMDDEEEEDEDILAIKQTLANPPDNKAQKGLKHYECPICFDNPEVIAVIPCGHMYCSDCVFKAIAVKGNCSICRKSVRHTQVKFLELKVKE